MQTSSKLLFNFGKICFLYSSIVVSSGQRGSALNWHTIWCWSYSIILTPGGKACEIWLLRRKHGFGNKSLLLPMPIPLTIETYYRVFVQSNSNETIWNETIGLTTILYGKISRFPFFIQLIYYLSTHPGLLTCPIFLSNRA